MDPTAQRIRVIDSHTAGEPTRVVVSGGPSVPSKGAVAARDFLRSEADWMRRSLILEPRGFDAVVGAFLCEPADPNCVTGVVFFNNVGYLPSCIHGTIGVMQTLAHLGRIGPGKHFLETPIGIISALLDESGLVTVENVACYRHLAAVTITVPGHGEVTGDIGWGGNWFYLIEGAGPEVRFANLAALTDFAVKTRDALEAAGTRGRDGELIDHVEIFGKPAEGVEADSQNFVLCPGSAYDRSPCGTGTSAKLACLAADGKLAEGEMFRQAGILGTSFTGTYRRIDADNVTPIVSGRAHITAECEFILSPADPFRHGIS